MARAGSERAEEYSAKLEVAMRIAEAEEVALRRRARRAQARGGGEGGEGAAETETGLPRRTCGPVHDE